MNKVNASFHCRFCSNPLHHTLVDLGTSPLCESYVTAENYNKPEPFFPLHVFVCEQCFLAQLDEFVPAEEIFTEYAYFSSYADSWVEHARRYCGMITDRFSLGRHSQVVELASNDGYLLQHFVAMGIPCYGVEPAANVAKRAIENNIPTEIEFFSTRTAQALAAAQRKADLILGNNVLAQVPDLNDFVAGIKIMMKPGAVMTIEFPHLLKLMEENQFDTIYHEHYCYFSLITAQTIFYKHGIELFDVEELPTHGGSLRIFGRHVDDANKDGHRDSKQPVSERLKALRVREEKAGLDQIATYATFSEKVKETKRRILTFLIEAKRQNKTLVGYGAPGKGNTLLNYCGIKTDFIDYTCDRNPYKQGRYLPGSRIPIFAPDKIKQTRPDYIVIMPWNFADEIVQQLDYVREWGGKFVVLIPEPMFIEPGDRRQMR